ncbi:MAG: ABC transporter permease [Actinomycetota bacterium]|nr:ABC transporter permease [Actinomycetota bacterium]
MIRIWLTGLLRRRAGRLLAAAFGVAVAVSLLASLGSFLTSSKATMTTRATSGVAVDWQVAVRPGAGGGVGQVLHAVRAAPGTVAALPVGFADVPGFRALTGGTTQNSGAGKVLGLPPGYASTFPKSIRLLAGSLNGVLVAQQTAANLRVSPGDKVQVSRPGMHPFTTVVSGVVELPQADSLFQRVGAPPQSQLVAPPDNVMLMPSSQFARDFSALARRQPNLVTTQIHVRRTHALPPDPAAAFVSSLGAAKNLEVATSGAGVVGDNLGAVLDAARGDALYSQILFLFLAVPGAALAAALTAAITQAGAARRRREQALLKARGSTTIQLFRLVLVEGLVTAVGGGLLGLLAASLIGRVFFGSAGFGASAGSTLFWTGASLLLGLLIVVAVVVVPARRELFHPRPPRAEATRPRWLSWGLDLVAIVLAVVIFRAAGANKYNLVLAPEGVPTLSVSYWAFLAPGLAWIGAALLGWRLTDLLLGPGRRLLGRLLRPATANLSTTVAAMMSRQRRPIALSAVLVGLALAFAMSTATFNSTYKHQAEADAQLTNGADVTVTESPGTRVAPTAAGPLAAVPGVRAVEPLQHRFAYVGADLQDFFGINPKSITRATTLQDAYFQGGSAKAMMARLGGRPDGVLVSAETVNDYQLSPGDQLRLRLQDSVTHRYVPITFHYVGIVNEFPTAPKDSFFVGNAAYVASQTHNAAVGTFLVSTGGTNVRPTAQRVQQLVGTSAHVGTISDARGLVGSSLTAVDLSGLTRLELAFALVIAVAAGGLVMGLGLNERRRSTAVATVVGASRRQVRALNLGEPLFIAIAGTVCGALTGWALSYLLVKVLTGVFDPPPTGLTVPWTYLLAVLATVLVAIGAATALVVGNVRRHAGDYLREF